MDPFKVLGVSNRATDTEIKEAYWKLAKEWHPDVNKSSYAVEKFKLISAAYDLLRTSEKKLSYLKVNYDSSDSIEKSEKTRVTNTWRGAEEAAKYKGGYRKLLIFERIVHPYTLMILIPLGAITYMGLSSRRKNEEDVVSTDHVSAWYNPVSARFETPQPWNEQFRKSGGVLKKVDRRLVHEVSSESLK